MIPQPAGGRPKRRCFCIDLSLIDYHDAWAFQTELVAARWENTLATDVILLLEHPSVFTLGRRGGMDNLTVSRKLLAEQDIPIVQVERGGNITFHGPGQLVVYPIMDLTSARLGVADYVGMLEEVAIRVAAHWGIAARRNPLNRGVWVGNRKIASIGIAIRRGISFHGIAINVNLPLEPFTWIHPCGLKGIGVTSMEKELGRPVLLDNVRQRVKPLFENIFGVELATARIDQLLAAVRPGPEKQAVPSQNMARPPAGSSVHSAVRSPLSDTRSNGSTENPKTGCTKTRMAQPKASNRTRL